MDAKIVCFFIFVAVFADLLKRKIRDKVVFGYPFFIRIECS